jgi:hypothetical protein
MDDLGIAQALSDQVHVPLRRGYSAGRLLLERVQDVQDALKTHRVNGPVGIAVKIVANLQNPAQALQGLGVTRMVSSCASKRACPISPRTDAGKPCKSFRLEPTKTVGLIARSRSFTYL